MTQVPSISKTAPQPGKLQRAWQIFLRYKYVYLMFVPVAIYYMMFHFIPMAGAVIAFEDYSPRGGLFGSDWVGLQHFKDFFGSVYFWRLMRNTLVINLYGLFFGFPAPIILALMLSEVRKTGFKRTVQTITYMPHFISVVVAAGIILDFFAFDGLVNEVLKLLGINPQMFMTEPNYFYGIFVGSGIWQNVGWDSIIYLSTISAIDPTLYEAAVVDGAGRWAKLRHVTFPGILPTIIIMLILRIGNMLSVGFEKVLLLYNPSIYETADVISTYVYRMGLLNNDYSYSTAVGLFNSVVNFTLLVGANYFSKKMGDNSLW
ncbi:MAG: sugar ABC transporter permease [Provencibacterium sp.]|jgi:putative aldouronate transport system permease protein|nr:sugar ABC transporter permease [Provencibacterium sp.]